MPPSWVPPGASREAVDRWAALLALLAPLSPGDVVAAVERSSPHLLWLLGCVRHPRATEVLCRHVSHADAFVRFTAVRALVRAGDPDGHACVERCLGDEDALVRCEAITGVGSWDPARAVGLYEAFLADPSLAPGLRFTASGALGRLREAGFGAGA